MGRWIVWRVRRGSFAGEWQATKQPVPEPPLGGRVEMIEVMPVAEHTAELQRVSEEYALQRSQLIDALTTCCCPVGWGNVVAEDCPRHNPRPQHTVSGASR